MFYINFEAEAVGAGTEAGAAMALRLRSYSMLFSYLHIHYERWTLSNGDGCLENSPNDVTLTYSLDQGTSSIEIKKSFKKKIFQIQM
jgi:hypothetical protein